MGLRPKFVYSIKGRVIADYAEPTPRANQQYSDEQTVQQYTEKQAWLARYYRYAPDGSYLTGKTSCGGKPCFDLIVATAASREEADRIIDDFNRRYPIAFQLWSTRHLKTPYAVVAGIGLPPAEALELAKALRKQYPGLNARAWRWPKFTRLFDLKLPYRKGVF